MYSRLRLNVAQVLEETLFSAANNLQLLCPRDVDRGAGDPAAKYAPYLRKFSDLLNLLGSVLPLRLGT